MIFQTLLKPTYKTALFIFSALAFMLIPKVAHAAAYVPGNLIANSVYTNYTTMNQSQIQSFLVGEGSGLAGVSDTEDCGSTSGSHYSFYATYYSCGQSEPASKIIYDASQAYGINPEAILATLEKEQSLVTTPYSNTAGYQAQVNCAMGYNSCGGYVGFFTQVDNGTWDLARLYQRASGNSTYWNTNAYPCASASSLYSNGLYPGNTVTFYDPGGTPETITLADAATAALYCYTPYVGPYGVTGYSGSYNFVTYFEAWFGSTQGVNYSWSIISQNTYADQTKSTIVSSTNIVAGSKIYAVVQAINTGNSTWTNSGPNAVDLGTTSPQDRTSAFCDTSDSPAWLSCNRAATMDESSVAPGGTATFEFWYRAPSVAGTYNEHFSLVAEGLSWMNDPGLYFHTVVQPITYSWSIVSQATYTDQTESTPGPSNSLTAGQEVYAVIVAMNTGNTTWYRNGVNPVNLGTTDPQDRTSSFCDITTWISCNRAATVLGGGPGGTVAPGGTGTFGFWYKAPNQPGAYSEHFSLVAEGLAWMNDPGLYFHTVVPFALGASTLGSSQTLSAGQSITSADGRYRLIMQGDGNLVLYSINRPLWASNTAGKPAAKVVMQNDGNLVLYDAQGKPYWASNTADRGTSNLFMQSDGNLVIYGSNGNPTWVSNTSGQL